MDIELDELRKTPLVQLERLARSLKVEVMDKEHFAGRTKDGRLLPEPYVWGDWKVILAMRVHEKIKKARSSAP